MIITALNKPIIGRHSTTSLRRYYNHVLLPKSVPESTVVTLSYNRRFVDSLVRAPAATATTARRPRTTASTANSALFSTMSRAKYVPSTLRGEPKCVLIPPGHCQFNDEFQPARLIERIQVSPTSFVLRFQLPDTSKPLGLSTCACVLAKSEIPTINDEKDEVNVEPVIRPYTPISTNADVGYFDLLIKNYGKQHGKLSHYLCETIHVGDDSSVQFKHIDFNVKIQVPFDSNFKHILMLVGGTGITPMIQALHAILGDDKTNQQNVSMVYGSRTSNDILGQELIDTWSKQYSDRFNVIHVLSDEPTDGSSTWTGKRGHIDRQLLLEDVAATVDDTLVLVCGPPPMYQALCGPRENKELSGLLADMGYEASHVYKF